LAFPLMAKVADGSMFFALVENFIETSLLKLHAIIMYYKAFTHLELFC